MDPTSDRPLFQQVADLLRERIMSRALAPGDRLPSETELINELGISRTTARLAFKVLLAEGLVDPQRGRGVFVRDRRAASRVASTRYRSALDSARAGTLDAAPQTAFTRDQSIGWTDYRLDREVSEIPAPQQIAELFGIDEGTAVLERSFLFYAADQPQQASRSYLLADMVRGTPVADPANEPWPGGTFAQLASLGIEVTEVRETVTARMPDPIERRRLHINEGVPVLCVTRVMLAGTRPVEVASDIVLPSDRFALDYVIRLDEPATSPPAPKRRA